MTSENVWYSATPVITGQVSGGGPIFDMPHPEALDTTDQEDAQTEWFETLTKTAGA